MNVNLHQFTGHRHAIITSMSVDYFEKYGKKMLNSFNRYCRSTRIPIFVFSEEYTRLYDSFQYFIQDEGIEAFLVNLGDISRNFLSFYSISSKSTILKGIRKDNTINKLSNINLWCRPLYSMLEGYLLLEPHFEFVHWFDADVIAFDYFEEVLDSTLPAGHLMSSLPRESQASIDFNIETGYVGFNAKRKTTKKLVEYIVNYTNTFKFLELNDWNDCTIMARGLSLFAAENSMAINDVLLDLAYYVPNEINHRFIYSHLLGSCFDHLKGDRKNIGKSHVIYKNLINHHKYWDQSV